MSLNIGDIAPNFTADTTHGMINFYEWMNNSWTIFLSHPKDFSPVCTTELIWLSKNISEFVSRNIKIISLSVDKLIHQSKLLDVIKSKYNESVNFPIISDKNMRIAKLYNMLNSCNKNVKSNNDSATTIRSVYIISPDKIISSVLNYPINTGRNFNEIIRVVDSLLITTKNKVATPANWSQGENPIMVDRNDSDNSFLGHPYEVILDTNITINNKIEFNVIKTDNVAC